MFEAEAGKLAYQYASTVALDTWKIYLENVQRLSTLCLEADMKLLDATDKAIAEAGKTSDINALIGIQSRFMNEQAARQLSYWQEVGKSIYDTHTRSRETVKEGVNIWKQRCAELVGASEPESTRHIK